MATLNLPFFTTISDRFRVVLASGSPRRRELLDRLNLRYEVIPSDFAEDLDKSQFASAGDYVLENAIIKAQDVYQRVKGQSDKPLLIIGADTVVVNSAGTILEKPASEQDAICTLKGLSGKANTVFTGVCLIVGSSDGTKDPVVERAVEATQVVFGDLDDSIIEAYVATGEPMDKAGSYAYQSLACFFVKEIKGDYYNVVGFPCARFYQMLLDLHHRGHF
ncbi:hypothetical protein LPJ66_004699 [Kickxella alabastrina]|uniref:Uncharacterized protein n=1 Tax=Kickxella alabastrina TaxID=61397 RepID=A0ACC1IKJ5_9FUNG|nr:hypothetical protein LPJ66_004699 [Kickxella alabastrina]